ncbi:MAG: FAD:protein FMN transferase [Pseudomonadota bacterium]
MTHWPRHLVLSFLILLAACGPDDTTVRISGETMGTTYNVVLVAPRPELTTGQIEAAISDTLAQVNAQMSNWDPDSEISRFNAAQTTDPVSISPALAQVVRAADDIHRASNGRFDVTLTPLIELWGFGERRPESPVPSDAEITQALALVGQARLLRINRDTASLTKTNGKASINLAAIAKGYGVDAVAARLEKLGIDDFMVEIGGDLVTAGNNPLGGRWRIGIERPQVGSRRVEQLVDITDQGLATSGDYRNYFEQDGVRYSHIIDPRTGRPITHNTASVTVVAENAMLADAWATALLVMGQDQGLVLAERLGLATLFIARNISSDDPRFIVTATSSFEALQQAPAATE